MFFKGTCSYGFLRRALERSPDAQEVFAFARPSEHEPASSSETVAGVLCTLRAELQVQARLGTKGACVPFPSARPGQRRLLTVGETKRKLGRVARLNRQDPHWARDVREELERETRQERRHQKDGPVLKRLEGLLLKLARDHDGAWTTLPPLAAIARQFGVSVRTLQTALNRLREGPETKLAFHSEPRRGSTGPNGRGRCVRVALKAWLAHDEKPLLFTRDGKPRGIRSSFRPDGQVLTPGKNPELAFEVPQGEATAPTASTSDLPDAPETAETSPKSSFFTSATNCKIRLSCSLRLEEPAERILHSAETPLQIRPRFGPATPGLKCSRNDVHRALSGPRRRLCWGVARKLQTEHFSDWDDDPQGWHRWRFNLPLPVIASFVAEAFAEPNPVTVATVNATFRRACYETNAAVFDGLARSPGALCRLVFRRLVGGETRPVTCPLTSRAAVPAGLPLGGGQRATLAEPTARREENDPHWRAMAAQLQAWRRDWKGAAA